MAMKAAYGSNPHSDRDPNNDHGWGGFQWPEGVPAELLSVVTVPGNVKIVVRKELAELIGVNYQIADVKYGRRFTRGWTGGYENRAIAGTSIPSNHSRGKAIDNDAQDNPMSSNFQCNIPPELVADWESAGFYWGGRYTGKSDTMHFEYCYSPADVPGHLAHARQILAGASQSVLGGVVGWPNIADGDYLGPLEGPDESHSGDDRFDAQDVRDAVGWVQRRVTAVGFDAGGDDGFYGPLTGRAVLAWQASQGRIQSGLVGRGDWDALHAGN